MLLLVIALLMPGGILYHFPFHCWNYGCRDVPGHSSEGWGAGMGANLVWRGYTDLWLVQFSIWCKHVSCIIISKCLGSILIPPAVGFLHIVSTHTLLLHKFIRPSTFHQTSIYIDLYHLSYGHSSPAPGTLLHQLPTQGVVGIGCHAQRTLHFQLGYWCRWKKPILSVNTVDTWYMHRGKRVPGTTDNRLCKTREHANTIHEINWNQCLDIHVICPQVKKFTLERQHIASFINQNPPKKTGLQVQYVPPLGALS